MSILDAIKEKIERVHSLSGGSKDFTIVEVHLKKKTNMNMTEMQQLRTYLKNRLNADSIVEFAPNSIDKRSDGTEVIIFHLRNFSLEKLFTLEGEL